MSVPARPLRPIVGGVLVAVAVAKRLCARPTGERGQLRGLTPVSKLEERRVGADGDGIATSAATPRDHRQRPQARPGRARAPARKAVDAGRSAERRAPESELVRCATSSGAHARGGTRALG
eukprot:scaffold28303_cov75-Phaeocystis_antarctica.AAC.1